MGRALIIRQMKLLMTQRLNPKIISVPVGQGVFSVPRGTMKLTVYLCGAGASSGYSSYHKPNIIETFHITGGAGGSGAYMKLYMYRRNYSIPQTIPYNNAAAQSTAFLQDGGAVSVTVNGTTYTAGGGVKPYQSGGGDGDTTNHGGAGGTCSVGVGGIVTDAVNGTTGQTGVYRGGNTPRTTGTNILGTVYGTGGGGIANNGTYQAYNQGDAGCLIFVCE